MTKNVHDGDRWLSSGRCPSYRLDSDTDERLLIRLGTRLNEMAQYHFLRNRTSEPFCDMK